METRRKRDLIVDIDADTDTSFSAETSSARVLSALATTDKVDDQDDQIGVSGLRTPVRFPRFVPTPADSFDMDEDDEPVKTSSWKRSLIWTGAGVLLFLGVGVVITVATGGAASPILALGAVILAKMGLVGLSATAATAVTTSAFLAPCAIVGGLVGYLTSKIVTGIAHCCKVFQAANEKEHSSGSESEGDDFGGDVSPRTHPSDDQEVKLRDKRKENKRVRFLLPGDLPPSTPGTQQTITRRRPLNSVTGNVTHTMFSNAGTAGSAGGSATPTAGPLPSPNL